MHHSSARLPLWVKSVVPTTCRSLPVYPDERTYSQLGGMSQRAKTGSGTVFGKPRAIDLRLIPSDSMDMEMRCPNWKDHSWLPYFCAILIFLCSRVVVALGLVFSRKYLTIWPEVWSAGPFWYHQLLQWDSEWYFKIVTEGYRYNGDPTIQQNVVFYPLYPMLAWGLAAISGLTPADVVGSTACRSGSCGPIYGHRPFASACLGDVAQSGS